MEDEKLVEYIKDFYKQLLESQIDLEPEINKMVSENFWDLMVKETE